MKRILIILVFLPIIVFSSCGKRAIEIPQEPPATTLGGSLEARDGFYVLYLRGSPEEMGKQHGTLLKDQISELTQKYIFEGFLKEYGISWEILVLMAKNYEAAMPEDFKTELRGIAKGSEVSYEIILVGQLMVDLAAIGSSSFIAKGGATSGEAIIHGSNIEWTDYNNALRNHLVIIYYEPSNGNKFVSLSYAGGAGVLIGMNEKHIALSITTINAGYNWNNLATTANLRKTLQYSNSLSEAANYLTASARTRGYTVPVSCGSPEGLFVMELSPTEYEKREIGTTETLVSTNHFISEKMKPYQVGTSSADSIHRYDTLMRLISQNYESISESLAKSFMSDRSELNGDYINSDWVIYSSILLPKDLAFWITKGPVSNEADYVKFSLN